MQSVNTPEEIEAAVVGVCALAGIDVVPKEIRAKENRYYQNQERLRDIELKRIEAGEIDCVGGINMLESTNPPAPEKVKQLRDAARRTNFNRAFVLNRGQLEK